MLWILPKENRTTTENLQMGPIIFESCQRFLPFHFSISVFYFDVFPACKIVRLSLQCGIGSANILSSPTKSKQLKIFNLKSSEVIHDCMLLFDCPSVQNVADKRKCKFMKKYAMSTNSICQLLAKMCV